MDRRQFLKQAGIGAAAIASVPVVGPTLLDALSSTAFASDQTNFTFVGVSELGSDALILNGAGRFGGSVGGGGSFTHVGSAGIVAFGTWRAKRFLSFDLEGTLGAHAAGVLNMEARFLPADGERVEGVMIELACNLPGLDTGKPEGAKVTFPDGAVFAPTEIAASLFSTGNENRG